MDPLTSTAATVWLWESFGKDLISKLGRSLNFQAKQAWQKIDWQKSAAHYHIALKQQHSTMRVLGKPDPVEVEGIYTDAYILDRPTALRRFDIEKLVRDHTEYESLHGEARRYNALELAKRKERLYVLGKPGAGKTTFLKYLTLHLLKLTDNKTPIFPSLHEWSNSHLELLPFIARQFDICGFPDAEPFIDVLLKAGGAFVMFDGLDEVNAEGERRATFMRTINDFVKQYPKTQYVITCRIAVSDYSFHDFTDVEVADFDSEQIEIFVIKWFRHLPEKGGRFLTELKKEQHRGLRELAQTPLLLTLLCLAFEETLTFSPNRSEIYAEALEYLLKKWDGSRNIKRDEVYKALTLNRKRQLFSQIATEYFKKGEIFFHKADLIKSIEAFMAKLPASKDDEPPDGETILKSIEAQHGLFIERAVGIYSFSHLTLQEYFTARYVVDNATESVAAQLINQHLTDRRWREVFLLTVSMLSDADAFFGRFRREVDRLIADDPQLLALINWAAHKALDYKTIGHPAIARVSARSVYTDILDLTSVPDTDISNLFINALAHKGEIVDPNLDLARNRDLDLDLDRAIDFARAIARAFDLDRALALDRAFALDRALDRARALAHVCDLVSELGLTDLAKAIRQLKVPNEKSSGAQWQAHAQELQAIMIQYRNIGHDWNLTEEQERNLFDYDTATILLAECLQLAAVSNRKEIEESLFLPPEIAGDLRGL